MTIFIRAHVQTRSQKTVGPWIPNVNKVYLLICSRMSFRIFISDFSCFGSKTSFVEGSFEYFEKSCFAQSRSIQLFILDHISIRWINITNFFGFDLILCTPFNTIATWWVSRRERFRKLVIRRDLSCGRSKFFVILHYITARGENVMLTLT